MKTHKNTRKWYKPKDRKAIKEKRRERRQKVREYESRSGSKNKNT